MKVTVSSDASTAYEFACHSAACAPPSAGGTGGSRPGGGGLGSDNGRNGQSLSERIAYNRSRTSSVPKVIGQVQPQKLGGPGKRNAAVDRAAANALGRKTSITEHVNTEAKRLGSSPTYVPSKLSTGRDSLGRKRRPEFTKTGGSGAAAGADDLNKRVEAHKAAGAGPVVALNRAMKDQRDAEVGNAPTTYKPISKPQFRSADVFSGGTGTSSGGVKGVKREQAIKAGPIKVSQVSVSKDGSVKLKGQSSEYKVVKGSDSSYRTRYQVEGIYISNQRLQSFKTQAAAKMAIVKQIRSVQEAS